MPGELGRKDAGHGHSLCFGRGKKPHGSRAHGEQWMSEFKPNSDIWVKWFELDHLMVGPLFGTHLFWGLYHVVHTNPQSWAECPLLAARASSHRDVTGSTAGEVTQWLNIQLAQCLRSLSERERESEMRCMYVHQRFAGAYRTSAQRSERSLAYLGLSQSRFFFQRKLRGNRYLHNMPQSTNNTLQSSERGMLLCMCTKGSGTHIAPQPAVPSAS